MKESIFIIAMGIVLWIIAFVFAVVMNADSNVLWICVIGALLGVIGLRYTIRRGRKEKL
jgi:NhaP-type Na+/H+ or K+/H+ antiporter